MCFPTIVMSQQESENSCTHWESMKHKRTILFLEKNVK